MSYTERFTEKHYPLIKIAPAVYSPASAVTSAYVNVKNYHRLALVIHLGAIAATGTVRFQLLQGDDSTPSNSKGIPTTVGQTKITSAIVDGDDAGIVVIELRTEELDVSGGFEHVAVKYDVDTDTCAFGAVLWGIEPRFAEVDSSAYNEIVDD